MVYSICIHSAWDLGVFCRQQHSWHPLGSSQGLKPQEICWEEWGDLWVSHAVQGGWLAERELLFKGIYLTGDQAARSPVVLEKAVGGCRDDKRHWTFCTECAEGQRLPKVETATSFRLDFLLPHHHLYRGREKASVPFWKVIATASFDWVLHYVELRTLLFMKRHPRKLQRRVEKKLQVLILIRGACLPGVRCLSVKSRR